MKSKLEFDLDSSEDRANLNRCLKSQDLVFALNEILLQVFRPARKHGYSEDGLQNLDEKTAAIIGLLEDKFHDILKDYSIDLEDL